MRCRVLNGFRTYLFHPGIDFNYYCTKKLDQLTVGKKPFFKVKQSVLHGTYCMVFGPIVDRADRRPMLCVSRLCVTDTERMVHRIPTIVSRTMRPLSSRKITRQEGATNNLPHPSSSTEWTRGHFHHPVGADVPARRVWCNQFHNQDFTRTHN